MVLLWTQNFILKICRLGILFWTLQVPFSKERPSPVSSAWVPEGPAGIAHRQEGWRLMSSWMRPLPAL